jgi:hypothetical protein
VQDQATQAELAGARKNIMATAERAGEQSRLRARQAEQARQAASPGARRIEARQNHEPCMLHAHASKNAKMFYGALYNFVMSCGMLFTILF